MAKETKRKLAAATADALSSELITSLNGKFKDSGHVAAYFLSDPDVATDVKDWVPTGCTTLDLAISNRPHGGYPVGKITEITGLEASGKSLLGAYALANTQKKGGVAVYIDTESAVSKEYLAAIGVDITKLIYMQLEALEDIFAAIESIVEKVRASDRNRLVTILTDSVMGATTLKELEADFGKDGYATDKAIILSKAMRKITGMVSKESICLIFTNQLRQRLNVSFGDPWGTSGGKALAFHSSVRLRLKSIGQIKLKTKSVDEIVGIKTRVQVIKNRLGPPLKSVDYDIYFNSGIDDYGSWLTSLKDYKIVTQAGAYYTLKLPKLMEVTIPSTGELASKDEIKFLGKDFGGLLDNNKSIHEYVYSLMCDMLIMKYKSGEDFGIDDVVIAEDDFLSDGNSEES